MRVFKVLTAAIVLAGSVSTAQARVYILEYLGKYSLSQYNDPNGLPFFAKYTIDDAIAAPRSKYSFGGGGSSPITSVKFSSEFLNFSLTPSSSMLQKQFHQNVEPEDPATDAFFTSVSDGTDSLITLFRSAPFFPHNDILSPFASEVTASGNYHVEDSSLTKDGVFYFISSRTITLYPAVPEPATWMLMISGFAMIGAVLRQRKALQTI